MNRSARLLALELVAVALTNEAALAQDGSVLTTLENQVVTAARGRQTTVMEAARSLFWSLAGGRLQRRSRWSRRSSSPSWSSSSARTSAQPPARWCFPPTGLLSAPRWRRRSAPRAMRSVREGRGGEGRAVSLAFVVDRADDEVMAPLSTETLDLTRTQRETARPRASPSSPVSVNRRDRGEG